MTNHKGYSRVPIVKDDVCLISFPRTGSNYFRKLLVDSLDYEILNSHSIDFAKNKRIVTIIRDPYPTLKSLKTMLKHFNPNIDYNNFTDYYLGFFEYMYENAEVIINYKTLIQTPDKVIDYIAKYFKIYNYQTFSTEMTKDNLSDGGLATSKSSPLYDNIDLTNEDFTHANKIYQKMLSRANI